VGSDPGLMAEAARMIEALGFAMLDLNFGCPVRKVTAPGGGAALLKDPKKGVAMMKAVSFGQQTMPA